MKWEALIPVTEVTQLPSVKIEEVSQMEASWLTSPTLARARSILPQPSTSAEYNGSIFHDSY